MTLMKIVEKFVFYSFFNHNKKDIETNQSYIKVKNIRVKKKEYF